MKNRFFKIVTLIALAAAIAATAVMMTACGKNDPKNNVTITINQSVATVEELETITLTATAENATEQISWSSSDTSVATVNGGVVYGEKEGTATITASANGASATCTVTVTKSINAPVIRFSDSLSLETGDVYVGSVKVTLRGEDVTAKSDITLSFADGSPEDVCSLSEENGKVTFTALKTGETEVFIATSVNGHRANKSVVIEVSEPTVGVFPSGSDVIPTTDGYTIELSTLASDGGRTSAELTFTAYEGGEATENATIEWDEDSEFYNPSVARVSGANGVYTVTKVAAGTTKLVGTYTSASGKTAPIEINVIVNRVQKQIESSAVIEVENLAPVAIPSEIDESVIDVLMGGVSVMDSATDTEITLKKSALPTTANLLGEVTLVIVTENCNYLYNTEMYTLVISDKADFDKFATVARANGDVTSKGILEGYFVMDADVEYNGTFTSLTDTGEIYEIDKANWQSSTYGFKGIFDGRGHSIDGLVVKERKSNECGGLFGYLHNDGVVKNVAFTNAGVHENNGFICFIGGGTIQNVSVTYASVGVGNTNRNLESDPRSTGTFFSYYASSTAKVIDCVVDATNATIYYATSTDGSKSNIVLGTKASKSNVENLVVITSHEAVAAKSGGTHVAGSYAEFIADENCQAVLDELDKTLWNTSYGIPIMQSVASKIDLTATVAFVNAPGKVYGNSSTEISVNMRYASVEASGLYDVVTFENGILSVSDGASGGTITLTAKSLINGTTDTKVITVVPSTAVTVAHNRVDVEVVANAELDLSFATDYLGSTATVYSGSTVLGNGAVSGGKTTIDATLFAEAGNAAITVFSEKNGTAYKFDVSVRVVTKIIRTAADLDAIRVQQSNIDTGTSIVGYYVLGNDIDLGGAKLGGDLTYRNGIALWNEPFGFRGTFDGNGHTISNFRTGKYGMFGHIGTGAVIANLNLDNVTITGDYLAAVFAGNASGATFSKINVKLTSGSSSDGIISSRYMKNNTLNEVTIDATGIDVKSAFGLYVSKNKFTSVTLKAKSVVCYGYSGDNKDSATISKPDGVTFTKAE